MTLGTRSRAAVAPPTPHARRKIDRDAATSPRRVIALRQRQPGVLVELADDARWNEAAPQSMKMVIAVGLPVRVKPMWDNQRQLIFGACHCHIEEAALLLDIAAYPVDFSEGMQPSTTLRTNTLFHSWPLG